MEVYDFLKKETRHRSRNEDDERLELLRKVDNAIESMDGFMDGINVAIEANKTMIKKGYAEVITAEHSTRMNKFSNFNNKMDVFNKVSAWQDEKTVTFFPENKELIKEKIDLSNIAKYLEHANKDNLITRIKRTFNGGIRMMWKETINKNLNKMDLSEINLGIWNYEVNKFEGTKNIVIEGIDMSLSDDEILNDLINRNNHIKVPINQENITKCKVMRLKRRINKNKNEAPILEPSRAVKLTLPKEITEEIKNLGYVYIEYNRINRIRDYEIKIKCNRCRKEGHIEDACWFNKENGISIQED